jgi:hypothetical protein
MSSEWVQEGELSPKAI